MLGAGVPYTVESLGCGWKIRDFFPGREKCNFYRIQERIWSHPASRSVGIEGTFLEVKWQKRDADSSLTSSVEVKHELSYW